VDLEEDHNKITPTAPEEEATTEVAMAVTPMTTMDSPSRARTQTIKEEVVIGAVSKIPISTRITTIEEELKMATETITRDSDK